MEIDPLTVVAVGGVVSLIIERIFYYKSKYKKKNNRSDNPGYGERIAKLETAMEGVEEDVKAIKRKLNLV